MPGTQDDALATIHSTKSSAIAPTNKPKAKPSFCGLNQMIKTAMKAKRYSRNSIREPPPLNEEILLNLNFS